MSDLLPEAFDTNYHLDLIPLVIKMQGEPNPYIEAYSLWSRDQASSHFLELLKNRSFNLDDVPQLTALLTLHPDLAQRFVAKKDGSGTEAPLMIAANSLAAYALMSYGAKPDKAHLPVGDTIPSALDSENFQIWWARFVGDVLEFLQSAIDKGDIEQVVSLIPYLKDQRRVKAPTKGSINIYSLCLILLEKGLADTKFMIDALSSVPPYYMLFRLFVCYGLNIEKDSLGQIPLSTSLRAWLAGNPGEESDRILELILELEYNMEQGRQQGLVRQNYLTMDYSILAYLNTKRLMPFWNDSSFWLEKYDLDYRDEGAVRPNSGTANANEARLRYLSQTTVIRAYDGNNILAFPYSPGRGFLVTLLLVGYNRDFLKEHPAFRDLRLNLFIEESSFFTWCSSYGLNFPDYQLNLPNLIRALNPDLLNLWQSGELLYQGSIPPSKAYSVKMRGVLGGIGLEAEVQFNSPDFLRGALTLCNYFGLQGKEVLYDLKKYVP